MDARVSPAPTVWVAPVAGVPMAGVPVAAVPVAGAGPAAITICWPILIRFGLARLFAETRESTLVPYLPAIPARVSPAETIWVVAGAVAV